MDTRAIGNTAQPTFTDKPAPASVQGNAPVRPVAAPVQAEASVQQPASVPDLEQTKQAVDDLNKTMRSMSNSLEFSLDEDSDRTVVKVVDSETGEVIRQMPSKEALEIANALDKVKGLLIRQQA